MNKYHIALKNILDNGEYQNNKKGSIKYLLNQSIFLTPIDLLEIFEEHPIARKKLRCELDLFIRGERDIEKYRSSGISWWDYCGSSLINSYPSYLKHLPRLVQQINSEKRSSKNYLLFLGGNDVESNQPPCLSLIQFQISKGKLYMTAYQRSSDASLGLPADIYHLYLISKQINLPLDSIMLHLGNSHIYENNLEATKLLLSGESDYKFNLNI
ncbi:MAG: thymidylate synthase [Vicingus serpentipes]|nr:thymidylate synthase [Vicingus serpentipes]